MEPPPSQTDMSISHPSIFVNRDGSPIQVFTEACGIRGRPKLMRTLRNFGASLSCDPRSAQIILVDQETTDGKKFIRNWGQDKIILHYAWAKKSIQEGKALLKDCNWGECLAVDDGLPIETEDTDAPELDNPLPTPRVTPVESKTKRPARVSHLSNPAPEVPIKPIKQDLMAEKLGTNDIAPTVTAPNLSQTMPAIPSMPMNVTESFPQTSYTMQMPNMTSMPPPMTPMMMAQITQYMMMMNSSNYPYNSQAQPTDFNSALIDALRIHNGQWPSSQPPQESPLQSNIYDRRSLTQQNYPYPNLSSNVIPDPNSQSTSMEAPARKRRRASSASSDSVPMQDVSEIKSESEPTPSATKRPKASPSVTKSSERKLFQSKSGKELSFFVQIEMHNRSAVVAAIKKHGGKIEGNNEVADYAILASGASKTKTFKDLLLSTVAAGRPALSARFVHESVDQNTLLDPRDFTFESPPTIRKRVKDEESSDVERKRLAKNARKSARRRELREEAAAQSSTQPQKKKESTSKNTSTALRADSGPPSPTPPLMHTREAVGNHFRFTDSERTYAIKYAQVLVERDHEISGQSIGGALHDKMPHHSAGSWRTYIGAPVIRDEIDRFRKRAGIAFRKAQEQKQSQATQSVPEIRQQNKPESEPEDQAVTPVTPSPTLVGESETDKKMAEEDDFNVIASFFAGSPDEDENESVVWERLTSQVTCKTSSSWEEFYNEHHEEVVKRYEKLCASNWQQT